MTERAYKKNVQILDTNTEVTAQEKEEIFQANQQSTEASNNETGKQLSKEYLVNKLNFTNFQDGTILINFKHEKYDLSISLHARPKPCLGNRLDCLWVETYGINEKLHSYQFNNFFVIDGTKLLSVTPEVSSMNDEGISFTLPETCYEISSRKVARRSCEGVNVQLIQNSSFFYGSLIDFNAVSFCIELKTVPPQTFQWLDKNLTVNIIFSDKTETLYAGECKISRNTRGQKTRKYVLEPIKSQIQRYQHKDHRSTRQALVPSPDIIFRHPFTKNLVSLKVIDISGSGFSVEEDANSPLLLPGMIIPELEIRFARSFKINCKAQVVYKKYYKDNHGRNCVKCGIVYLDIDIQHHVHLLALLQQAEDENSHICNEVDMDALWDFFFETGFIYPSKYEFIQKNKKQIKETYKKLYTQNPTIARHFIYQDKGYILGHMAMIRFYENTWLIHHHAARSSLSRKAGLKVLEQIGRFGNDSHRLYSIHMDFLMCYYRPDNKFPSRVFGGAARYIKDPKKCSLDDFAYFHYKNIPGIKNRLSEPWQLAETRSDDLLELENFYKYTSGGLMINALNLEPGTIGLDELSKEYQKLGFKRERLIFSLKKSNNLKAIIMVNISDIGLNLSDLTRCIKVIILDSSDLSREVLHKTLLLLTDIMKQKEISVLLYPASYAEKELISYEKLYTMWIINLQYTDSYFKFIDRLLRFIPA
ncbi:MAG: PilZ domain-containing protein [Deltaproteobacteria bacterium]|nr:PilZ domain-containing protein [Deltaproteobacteria bacterium]